jgi:preprotein translocase subunit SecG
MGAIIVSILILLVCVLLILVVLVQNSKGGGLASNFSSSSQVMGVRRTADVLEKATWIFAGALLFLCIISTSYTKRSDVATDEPTTTESVTRKKAGDIAPPPTNTAPAPTPTTAPAPGGTPQP